MTKPETVSDVTRPKWILPAIVFSQFAGTSLWFAGNAVVAQLPAGFSVTPDKLGAVISAVQLGFIVGTLLSALYQLSDRMSVRLLFLLSAVLGAGANLAPVFLPHDYSWLLFSRFMTGFALAGLYPVGMKIASGWFKVDLSAAIGYLVGALVLGTALPHLLASSDLTLNWQLVLCFVSLFALAGACLLYIAVPDGPFLAPAKKMDGIRLKSIFASADFRASAFGYFGHMWELYAFWTFIPVFLMFHIEYVQAKPVDIPFWSFLIVASGAVGCVVGGWLSRSIGSVRVAVGQLTVSGICCIISPLMVAAPTVVFLCFMLLWGITVVGDSPQFSTLNASTAPAELVGSALTIVNCIGFFITIISIQLIGYLQAHGAGAYLFIALLVGPVVGIRSMLPLFRKTTYNQISR